MGGDSWIPLVRDGPNRDGLIADCVWTGSRGVSGANKKPQANALTTLHGPRCSGMSAKHRGL